MSTQFNPDLDSLLSEYLKLPQRHRLLHGYPLHHKMSRIDLLTAREKKELRENAHFHNGFQRGLLIGVLPHPFCNPRVPGCGFCTFPNEPYRASAARKMVDGVIREIHRRKATDPELIERKPAGLYIGGGTANLTPSDALKSLAGTLARTFDLANAEITLEGVAAYFLKPAPPLPLLQQSLNARHFRISMGIQSFNPTQLQRMGREHFGDHETFSAVTHHAHQHGATVSVDLLFNLPGQSRQEMLSDLDKAIDLGVAQICLYNLVLFKGLGTEWSLHPELLETMPDNNHACENWRSLQDKILRSGYRQTSLTNFEKEELNQSEQRFIYEEFSYHPNQYDMLGFGPSAISFSADNNYQSAWKTVNQTGSEAYLKAIETESMPWDRYHLYDQEDLRLFFLIRRLAACNISVAEYQETFNSPGPVEDFPEFFHMLFARQLMEYSRETIAPTAKGIFYADAMASLLITLTEQQRQARADSRTIKSSSYPEHTISDGIIDDSNMYGDM